MPPHSRARPAPALRRGTPVVYDSVVPVLLRAFTLALAVLGAAGPAPAADPTRLVAGVGPVKVGAPFPTFAGFDLGGGLVTSRGLFATRPASPPASPVVVSFFATWCKPCERHLPELARAAAAAGARVVLVDVGDEDPGAVRAFLEAAGAKATVVLADKALAIARRAGVTTALPRTFVLDGGGTVRALFDHEGDDFEVVLARELAPLRPAAPPLASPAALAR